ncbi:hypothetical protein HETIRDRAFT_315959 [Heterobasidion irregulare TC 32-1]|uniref:Uncharacterized protein n=1 Tax=Heterobasidion irregulare (strain TC 32-1) TaxID=747525 RepID=W4KAM4_HETIT|nr:uncharacterized protein HETIRDRAFT_315959 [Heterobasidion irregulare TC 32-1]ETW82415.1 hypothetical protein HETIRDRAFT_315959 [Heterobasidion irregulare TC 32-1]
MCLLLVVCSLLYWTLMSPILLCLSIGVTRRYFVVYIYCLSNHSRIYSHYCSSLIPLPLSHCYHVYCYFLTPICSFVSAFYCPSHFLLYMGFILSNASVLFVSI